MQNRSVHISPHFDYKLNIYEQVKSYLNKEVVFYNYILIEDNCFLLSRRGWTSMSFKLIRLYFKNSSSRLIRLSFFFLLINLFRWDFKLVFFPVNSYNDDKE